MSRGDEPAYPTQEKRETRMCGSEQYEAIAKPAQPGLTKRELIAAMAMQGLLAAPDLADWPQKMFAETAVEHADALLAELEKPR